MSETRSKSSVRYNLVWTLTLACLLLATAGLGGYVFIVTKSAWAILATTILIFALALAFVHFRVRLRVALARAGETASNDLAPNE